MTHPILSNIRDNASNEFTIQIMEKTYINCFSLDKTKSLDKSLDKR